MSAAVASVPTSARGTFEDGRELLTALFGGSRGFMAWFVGRGTLTREDRASVEGLRSGFVPGALLQALAAPVPDDIRIGLCTRDESGQLLDVGAVAVEFTAALEHDPEAGTWCVPEAFVADVATKLQAFPLPPSIIVDQGAGCLAAWLLASPVAVTTTETRERVEVLQRHLAERLGAGLDLVGLPNTRTSRTAGDAYLEEQVHLWELRRPVLRLPGSLNHDAGRGNPVVLERLDATRRYTLTDLEQAATPSAVTPKLRKAKS